MVIFHHWLFINIPVSQGPQVFVFEDLSSSLHDAAAFISTLMCHSSGAIKKQTVSLLQPPVFLLLLIFLLPFLPKALWNWKHKSKTEGYLDCRAKINDSITQSITETSSMSCILRHCAAFPFTVHQPLCFSLEKHERLLFFFSMSF